MKLYHLECYGLVAVLTAGPAAAATYVVYPDGTGEFPTIQAAINEAVDGDIVELADGTFTGDGNRDIDFVGKAITVRSQSGDPEVCIIDCQGSMEQPHRAFVFQTSEGPASMLEGVTVQGGHIPGGEGGEQWPEYHGGGILVDNGCSPTFRNCVISQNIAGDAGGVACGWTSSASFTDCVFSENEARYMETGGLGAFGSHVISNCYFVGNWGQYVGGGGTFGGGSTLSDCHFIGNSCAGVGGGAFFGSGVTVLDCAFIGNACPGDRGGGAALTSNSTLINCIFIWNEGGTGGAIHASSGGNSLQNCTLYGTSTTGACSGAICSESSLSVMNTIVAFSTQGTAISVEDIAYLEIECCDLFGNADGDWIGNIEDQYGVNGNISEDPLFCDPENGDFTIRSDSPCAPFSPPNEDCDLIGAWPVGCEPPTTVEESTWGRIKAAYR